MTATGIEQRPYNRTVSFEKARDINTAATAEDQLDELVDILGTGYSTGDVHDDVNKLVGIGPGATVGALLRLMGDAQRVNPNGSIDLIMRAGLSAATTIKSGQVESASSRYKVSLDTTVRRVLAYGAPVKFIATGTLERVTESGVNRAVATITPPTNTELLGIEKVIARQGLAGKFSATDELDGVWDPDHERFEWSGTLSAGDTALVEMHGTWRTEDIVNASDPDALARDATLDVPLTAAADIRSAANRYLNQRSEPVETLTLDIVLGAAVPRLDPGDAVKVTEELQKELDVYLPEGEDLWLVHAVALSQPAHAQADVRLDLSRRLPDYRTRDFWSGEDGTVPGSGGRQVVIGSGGGAPTDRAGHPDAEPADRRGPDSHQPGRLLQRP